MEEFLRKWVRFAFDTTDIYDKLSKLVLQSPEQFSQPVWQFCRAIFENMLVIGYSLLALCLVLELLYKTMTLEHMNAEQVVKILLKIVLGKAIMENAFWFLTKLLGLAESTIRIVQGVNVASSQAPDVLSALENAVPDSVLPQIAFSVGIAVFCIVMFIVQLVVLVVVYGRFFELFVMTAVAPIPVAFLLNDSMRDIATKFLRNYASLCFQGMILLLITKIYGAVAVNLTMSSTEPLILARNMTIMGLVMMMAVVKSSSWAKSMVGLGDW